MARLGEPRAERRQRPIDELLPVRVVARGDRAPLDPPGHLRRKDVGDRRSPVPPGDERAPDHLAVGLGAHAALGTGRPAVSSIRVVAATRRSWFSITSASGLGSDSRSSSKYWPFTPAGRRTSSTMLRAPTSAGAPPA